MLISNRFLADLESQISLVLGLKTLLVLSHDSSTLFHRKEIGQHIVTDFLSLVLYCLDLTLMSLEGLTLDSLLVRIWAHFELFDPLIFASW